MIAMQVADENMIDFREPYPVLSQLHLGAFTAVD
jgi:hypothetical protein